MKRNRKRTKTNPFFAPEAMQYVAQFAGLSNPPAGRALFEADNDVLYNPDESLQRLERLVEQTPNDLGLSLQLLRARMRAGVPFGAELQRVAAMAREPGVDAGTREQVLQALVEADEASNGVGGMFFADIVVQILGSDRHDPHYPPDGFGRVKAAEVFRGMLKKLGAGPKDLSLKTPDYSMADSIDVQVKTVKGRQALEELFLFMEAGGSGGPPTAISRYLYPGHREDRSVPQADEYNPGGPVIRNRHVLDVAKRILHVAFGGGSLAGVNQDDPAARQEFQPGEVVRRRDVKGLAAKKRWIVSGFVYDNSGRRQHQLTAMSGGVKGSEIESAPGHALVRDENQSETFEGPNAHQLRRSHEHRLSLHGRFHPNGFYAKDPRRYGGGPSGSVEPIMEPVYTWGAQVWITPEGDTLVQVAPPRLAGFKAAMHRAGLTPTETFTPGVYSLGGADPGDVWAALVDGGFEGMEPPADAAEGRLYMKNPRKKKETKGPFNRAITDQEKAAIVQIAMQHGADASRVNMRMSRYVGPFFFPPPNNVQASRAFEAAAGQAVPGAHADVHLLRQPGGGTDTMIAVHETGPQQNPFFAPEAMQYVARFSGLANPPSAFSCAVCSKAFAGRGRALYDPISRTWYHKNCVKSSALPEGRRLYQRLPDHESLAKFADYDEKLRGEATNPPKLCEWRGCTAPPFGPKRATKVVAYDSGLAYYLCDEHAAEQQARHGGTIETLGQHMHQWVRSMSGDQTCLTCPAVRGRQNPADRRCAACLIRLPGQAPAWAPQSMFGTCATCAERAPDTAHQRMNELSASPGPFVFPKNLPKSLGAEAPATFYKSGPRHWTRDFSTEGKPHRKPVAHDRRGIPIDERCMRCAGSGFYDGDACYRCGGSGRG